MIIGTLNNELKGKIQTLKANFQLKLIPNNNKKDDKSPTHNVLAYSGIGEPFVIGAAWERLIQNGNKIGQKMYSLAIDDPSFEVPLNCSAFPHNDGFSISWERQIKEDGF